MKNKVVIALISSSLTVFVMLGYSSYSNEKQESELIEKEKKHMEFAYNIGKYDIDLSNLYSAMEAK